MVFNFYVVSLHLRSPKVKQSAMNIRPRRNRKSAAVRDMIRETHLGAENLIYPMFILDGEGREEAIDALPGISRFSQDKLLKEIESCLELGFLR